MEALFDECQASETMVDPEGLPAAFGDGGNPGMRLEFGRRLPARPVRAEGGRQARGADGASAGETGEELGIRMGRKDRGDAGLERLDGLNEDAQLRGVGLHGEPQRVDDGRVGGQGPGTASRSTIPTAIPPRV